MPKSSPAPVPQTRLGRIAQIGLAAGEFAIGAAAEALKRFARGEARAALARRCFPRPTRAGSQRGLPSFAAPP